MSVFAIAWAKAQRTGSPTRKLVLQAIADYADDRGICWPSQRTLARETELSVRSIRRALDDLEDAGFICRKGRSPTPSGTRRTDVIALQMAPGDNLSAGDQPGDTVSKTRGLSVLSQGSQCPPIRHKNHHKEPPSLSSQEGKVGILGGGKPPADDWDVSHPFGHEVAP